MMQQHPHLQFVRFVLILGAVAALSGCVAPGAAFSPEAAVQQAVLRDPGPDIITDPTTVQILQRAEVDGKTLVMLSFGAAHSDLGGMSCLYLYEARWSLLGGWRSGSGGGSCSTALAENEPLSIGAGQTSGSSPFDPGYSTVYGQVFSPDITAVRVTWKDSQVSVAEVVNGSYLAVRSGKFEMVRVEGLNTEGETVYKHQSNIAPAKRPIEEE